MLIIDSGHQNQFIIFNAIDTNKSSKIIKFIILKKL
jgi:hypothetical protein